MEDVTGNEMRRTAIEMMKANKLRYRKNNRKKVLSLIYRGLSINKKE